MVKKEKKKVEMAVGKRKFAVARATVSTGTGKITINSIPFELWGNEISRLRIKEPLLLAGELAKNVDIKVNVKGGGVTGQTDAIRVAITNALINFYQSEELKQKILSYDRSLLISDTRRPETRHAGGASKRGSRRHKQRSKR
ncbi:MAG: 30S ribosomal protein S9 [Candidatus Aenigmatarchaeota archaeon]